MNNIFEVQLIKSKLAIEKTSREFHRTNPYCPHCKKTHWIKLQFHCEREVRKLTQMS